MVRSAGRVAEERGSNHGDVSVLNRPNDGKDLTLNFFYRSASTTKTAQLACPFFTDARPIFILREAGCGNIKLLVRLCEATSHVALADARAFESVDVRFFTSGAFHAKFYVLGRWAPAGRQTSLAVA